jgi:hypothetical protein
VAHGRRGDATRVRAHSRAKERRALWWACWSAIVLAGLTLKFLEPSLYLLAAGFDDELFVAMAHGYLQGHWSSSWATTGIVTLTKPVGYPLFLAGVHFFPWSPVLSAYILYVIGACLIVWGWFRMRNSRPQATLLLAILVFNPISFSLESQRVYRDLFMMALFTLAVGVSFVLASLLHHWEGGTRRREGWVHREGRFADWAPIRWAATYVLVVVLGSIVGLAAITKETWVALLPAAVAPLIYLFIQRLRPSRFRPYPVLRAALAGLVFLGSVWGVINVTKQLNYKHYHVAVVDDLSSGAFARTWKLWASVEAGRPQRYVAITRAMRLAVYQVSPAAAEMEPDLENPKDSWKLVDCEEMKICDGESGPWFEWDLLTAAYSTGRIHSLAQIQTYFSEVGDQIASACKSGQLRCSGSPVLATSLPRLNQIPLSTVSSDTVDGLWQMLWERLPLAQEPIAAVSPTTSHYYALWASVVRGMPSYAKLTKGVRVEINPILRVLFVIYRIVDLILLSAIALAIVGWTVVLILRRVRRDPRGRVRRSRPDVEAGLISILMLISALIGMGSLALLAASEDPGYIMSLYWTDFASVLQLSLVFGLFCLLPSRKGRLRNRHRSDELASSEPYTSLTVRN